MLCKGCENLTIETLYQRACDHPPGSKTGWNQAGYVILHEAYESLESSAQTGCKYCQIFHSRFISVSGGIDLLRKKLDFLANPEDPELPIIAFLEMAAWQAGKRPITRLLLQVGTEPWKAGPDDSLIAAFRISTSRVCGEESNHFDFRYIEIDHNLGTDENFAIAQNWISDCCSEHDQAICPPLSATDLPTRLIDVGPVDGSREPRLITSPKNQKDQYLALSHCWGPSSIKERLTTTFESLNSRMEAIPMSQMPANFYDATIITRRLGYKYLWIDSLCIIQDSYQDWETESQNMGNIYKNASVTLAAAAAKDSDGGMLKTNYDPSVLEAKFEPSRWFLTDRKKLNFYASQDPKSRTVTPDSPLEGSGRNSSCQIKLHQNSWSKAVILTPWMPFSDLEENFFRCAVVGPLAHRGWTLQERILSRRILYYGSRQIYWQCASSRKAADGENVPVSAATSFRSVGSSLSEWPDLIGLEPRYMEAQTAQSNGKSREAELQIRETWYTILQLYVNRRLTKETDKLPALAGMAEFIHSLTNDSYVAGFWRKDLLISLLWSIVPTWAGTASSQYEIEVPQWELKERTLEGPSWSWAAADIRDRLEFWAANTEKRLPRIWKAQDADILDVHLELFRQNPFGRVKSGRLIVRGFTYPRSDVRTTGWDPYKIASSINAKLCPNETGNTHDPCLDRVVLWDYVPRHRMAALAMALIHSIVWFFNVFNFVIWQGTNAEVSGQPTAKNGCSYCKEYLCLHVLSIADKDSNLSKASGRKQHEVDLWSLILEPVDGKHATYRRIGVAWKAVHISEEEFACATGPGNAGVDILEPFSAWNLKTVTII